MLDLDLYSLPVITPSFLFERPCFVDPDSAHTLVLHAM